MAQDGSSHVDELNYRAMQGVRQEALLRLRGVDAIDLMVIQVALEGQRYLVAFFLGSPAKPKAAKETKTSTRRRPPTRSTPGKK